MILFSQSKETNIESGGNRYEWSSIVCFRVIGTGSFWRGQCWADCPALAEADLGTYQTTVLGTTVTGENAELVENLYLGRRAFYEDVKAEKAARAREGAERLWQNLTKGANP